MKREFRISKILIANIILPLAIAPAQAAIMYLENNSFEEYGSISGGNYYSTPSNDPLYWNSRSNLGPMGFSDMGAAYSDNHHILRTTFDITFRLDEATDFLLTGSLYQMPYYYSLGLASVSLYSGNDVIYRQGVSGDYDYDFETGQLTPIAASANLSFTQILAAGEYRFVARADPGSNGDSRYQFNASVIPLPAAIWLFVSGLVGVMAVSRRSPVKR